MDEPKLAALAAVIAELRPDWIDRVVHAYAGSYCNDRAYIRNFIGDSAAACDYAHDHTANTSALSVHLTDEQKAQVDAAYTLIFQ